MQCRKAQKWVIVPNMFQIVQVHVPSLPAFFSHTVSLLYPNQIPNSGILDHLKKRKVGQLICVTVSRWGIWEWVGWFCDSQSPLKLLSGYQREKVSWAGGSTAKRAVDRTPHFLAQIHVRTVWVSLMIWQLASCKTSDPRVRKTHKGKKRTPGESVYGHLKSSLLGACCVVPHASIPRSRAGGEDS